MQIEINGNEVTLAGNMINIDDHKLVKEKIMWLINGGVKDIVIFTPSPFSITSSIVGFFTKIIFQDKVKLTLYIKDPILYGLMEDLNLVETFNIKKDF